MAQLGTLLLTMLIVIIKVFLSDGQNLNYTIIESSYNENSPGFYGWDSREELYLCHKPEYKYNRLLYGERKPGDIIDSNVNCFWNKLDEKSNHNITLFDNKYKITFVNFTITTKNDITPELKLVDGGIGRNFVTIHVSDKPQADVEGYYRVFSLRDYSKH